LVPSTSVGVEEEIVELVVNTSFETHDIVKPPSVDPLTLLVVSETNKVFCFNDKRGPT